MKLKDYFWGFSGEKIAVEIESLRIDKGEKVGIVGLNGSGKSTLIKMITGIIKSSEGKVEVFGENPIKKRRKISKSYGIMFGQRTQLKWDLPAIESYRVLKEMYRVDNNDYKKTLETLIKELELEEIIYQPVRTLSLGQKVRVELASIFLHNPKLLILDEPTIGLDFKTQKLLSNFVKNWVGEEKSLILTSHNFLDIENMCKRLIVLDKGKIIFDGSVDGIVNKFRNYCNLFVTFDSNNISDLKIEDKLGAYEVEVVEDSLKIKHILKSEVDELIGKITSLDNNSIKNVSIENIELKEIIEKITKGDIK